MVFTLKALPHPASSGEPVRGAMTRATHPRSGSFLCAAYPLQMLLDDGARELLAAAAATGDRQFALHLVQRLCTALDGLADICVGDSMADADVHRSMSFPKKTVATLDHGLES
jgi:hypothetical protein